MPKKKLIKFGSPVGDYNSLVGDRLPLSKFILLFNAFSKKEVVRFDSPAGNIFPKTEEKLTRALKKDKKVIKILSD